MEKDEALDLVVKIVGFRVEQPNPKMLEKVRGAAEYYLFNIGQPPQERYRKAWTNYVERILIETINDLTQAGGRLAGLEFDRSRIDALGEVSSPQHVQHRPASHFLKPKQR